MAIISKIPAVQKALNRKALNAVDADGNLISVGQRINPLHGEYTPNGGPFIVTKIVGDKIYFLAKGGGFEGVLRGRDVVVFNARPTTPEPRVSGVGTEWYIRLKSGDVWRKRGTKAEMERLGKWLAEATGSEVEFIQPTASNAKFKAGDRVLYKGKDGKQHEAVIKCELPNGGYYIETKENTPFGRGYPMAESQLTFANAKFKVGDEVFVKGGDDKKHKVTYVFGDGSVQLDNSGTASFKPMFLTLATVAKNWNYKNNYQFFCIDPSMSKPCILSGWDYKEDAQEDAQELKWLKIPFKIVSRRTLEQKGIDPNDAASWKKNRSTNSKGEATMIKSTNAAVQKALNRKAANGSDDAILRLCKPSNIIQRGKTENLHEVRYGGGYIYPVVSRDGVLVKVYGSLSEANRRALNREAANANTFDSTPIDRYVRDTICSKFPQSSLEGNTDGAVQYWTRGNGNKTILADKKARPSLEALKAKFEPDYIFVHVDYGRGATGYSIKPRAHALRGEFKVANALTADDGEKQKEGERTFKECQKKIAAVRREVEAAKRRLEAKKNYYCTGELGMMIQYLKYAMWEE